MHLLTNPQPPSRLLWLTLLLAFTGGILLFGRCAWGGCPEKGKKAAPAKHGDTRYAAHRHHRPRVYYFAPVTIVVNGALHANQVVVTPRTPTPQCETVGPRPWDGTYARVCEGRVTAVWAKP